MGATPNCPKSGAEWEVVAINPSVTNIKYLFKNVRLQKAEIALQFLPIFCVYSPPVSPVLPESPPVSSPVSPVSPGFNHHYPLRHAGWYFSLRMYHLLIRGIFLLKLSTSAHYWLPRSPLQRLKNKLATCALKVILVERLSVTINLFNKSLRSIMHKAFLYCKMFAVSSDELLFLFFFSQTAMLH